MLWPGPVQGFALLVGSVDGAGLVEAFVDLGADEVRVGEQAGDVVPDDLIETVGADGLLAQTRPPS
jgi:hypothetical protein